MNPGWLELPVVYSYCEMNPGWLELPVVSPLRHGNQAATNHPRSTKPKSLQPAFSISSDFCLLLSNMHCLQ